MPHGLFQTLSGKEGTVQIPALGAVIGQFQSWKMMRRGDGGPKEGLYDLHAVFSYVNPHLFNHDRYASSRAVFVKLGRRTYKLEQAEGGRTSLDGRALIMEEVRLSG